MRRTRCTCWGLCGGSSGTTERPTDVRGGPRCVRLRRDAVTVHTDVTREQGHVGHGTGARGARDGCVSHFVLLFRRQGAGVSCTIRAIGTDARGHAREQQRHNNHPTCAACSARARVGSGNQGQPGPVGTSASRPVCGCEGGPIRPPIPAPRPRATGCRLPRSPVPVGRLPVPVYPLD